MQLLGHRGGRLLAAWSALGAAAALLPALWMWGFTVDDALIAVRYARHLVQGSGWRFNLHGASTDGVTPLPWPLVLAPFARADALVVPLSEYALEDNASLQLITYQRLDQSAWHVARTTGFVARDARLRQAVVGIGAHYNRSRNDAEMHGAGSENELRTTFLGSGDQVHDFRTHQMHTGARSRSTLLSKGAVADRSRSVYTGLIEIEKGAKRTDARQTNHNLLLSPAAHADSVPNLDIRENDVMCAHASSVGPLDELQRWYLESRGVSREDAERLMIQGFFYEMLANLPPELAELVERDVTSVLATVNVVTP